MVASNLGALKQVERICLFPLAMYQKILYFCSEIQSELYLTNLKVPNMENIVTFANEKQLLELKGHQFMMDEMDHLKPVSNSEEEVKLLLAERLQRIAEGNAVTVPHEEVKSHIKALLQNEYQMA